MSRRGQVSRHEGCKWTDGDTQALGTRRLRALSMSCPSVVLCVLMCSCSCVRPHTMHAGFGGSGFIVVTSRGVLPRNASCTGHKACCCLSGLGLTTDTSAQQALHNIQYLATELRCRLEWSTASPLHMEMRTLKSADSTRLAEV